VGGKAVSDTVDDLLKPPDDATVNRAIREFARVVRALYGDRLKGLYLFGSRARGDHTRDSDADVVVVLDDRDFDFWTEKMRLADLEHDIIVETGAEPQAWPLRESDWLEPARHRNPELVKAMWRDGRKIEVDVDAT
jgi:predicted nucleotidyltransferase